MRSVVTPKDLAVGNPVPAGWYPLTIKNVSIEVTKGTADKPSDGSENAVYEFVIKDGPVGVQGKTIKRYYNEKALGFGKSLWATLFPQSFDKEKGGELNNDMFISSIGRDVMGYVKMDGKYATIEDFRPMPNA